MWTGLDVLLNERLDVLKGKNVGLITNITGVNRELEPTIDLFHEHPHIHLHALYAPEHGIRGDAPAGQKIASFTDERTGLTVYSLYGKTKKPSAEMLAGIDVMVLDLQDIGSRYYTYIYTMAHVMEACGEANIPFVVLDRPNPIGGTQVEGNCLKTEEVSSFVGMFPIPNRHGLTIGELALLFHEEFRISCDVHVIPMQGWQRSHYFDETSLIWVPPSPNTTGIDMCMLYPGTCLLEGTNISEGRGTAFPFEWIGAPFLDGHQLAKAINKRGLSGVLARPVSFIPSYQKYEGQLCHGIQLHVTDRKTFRAFDTGMVLLDTIATLVPDSFEFITHSNGKYFFDLLAGTTAARSVITEGNVGDYLHACREEATQFQTMAETYRLYA